MVLGENAGNIAGHPAIVARVASAEDQPEQSWCILRTGGSRTLPLCRSLVAAGMEAWTPTEVAEKRRGKSRGRVEIEAPILPTFVFADAALIPDLLALESAPTSPHPSFSLFRYLDRVAIICDRELTELRTEEGRASQAQRRRELARLRKEKRPFTKGQEVRVRDGPFTGLTGKVEKDSTGRYVFVCFGESRWKIAAFHLQEDVVKDAQS